MNCLPSADWENATLYRLCREWQHGEGSKAERHYREAQREYALANWQASFDSYHAAADWYREIQDMPACAWFERRANEVIAYRIHRDPMNQGGHSLPSTAPAGDLLLECRDRLEPLGSLAQHAGLLVMVRDKRTGLSHAITEHEYFHGLD